MKFSYKRTWTLDDLGITLKTSSDNAASSPRQKTRSGTVLSPPLEDEEGSPRAAWVEVEVNADPNLGGGPTLNNSLKIGRWWVHSNVRGEPKGPYQPTGRRGLRFDLNTPWNYLDINLSFGSPRILAIDFGGPGGLAGFFVLGRDQ